MEKRDHGLKHLRRLLVALLSLALVFTLMACGQNNNQGGGEAPAPVESQAPAAAADFEQTVQPNYTGTLIPTFTQRTGDEYSIGVYVKDNKVTAENSYLKDFAEESADGVTIKDLAIDASGTGFTAIAVQGAEGDGNSTVNISNVDINLTDDSDGTNGCDFTGLGTAIVASGVSEKAHNTVNIDNTTVKTKGFVRDGIIVDDYTDAIITNSSFTTFGADPLKDSYDGYLNTAKQAYMLSPPWIMSFLGGARTANVLGDYSSLTVVDSVMQTGAWAVLSTDDCTEPTVNVINSTIEVLPADSEYGMNGGAELYGYDYNYGSGYGTYSIGSANEYFYGAEFKGVTMATVMTGTGETYYGPSFNGMTVKNGTGEEIYTYPGESRETVVNGVNGIMDHQGGTATLDAGSVWNTEEAVILKKGSNKSTFTVSGAEMNSKSGILFQLMDDDDGYGTSGAGGDTAALTYDGQAWGMPTFSGGFYDPAGAGLPATLGNLAKGGNISSTLNLTGGIYNGNVYNGSGSGKDKDAQGLQVNISHADVTGAITSAQTVHGLPINDKAIAYLDALKAEYGAGIAPQGGTDGKNGDGTYTVDYALLDAEGNVVTDAAQAKFIQITEFTINEYYMIGHVINWAADGAAVDVVMDGNSKWNVTSDSYISYLKVEENSEVVIADGATLYIAGQPYTGTVGAGEYGTKSAEAEDGGGMMPGGPMPGGPDGMPGGMPGGDMGGMPGGDAPAGDAAAEGGDAPAFVMPTIDKTVQLSASKK